MKVLQILPELNAGGVERGTLEIGKYLVGEGHESLVVSNGGRLVDRLEAEGSRHITLPVHRKRLGSLRQVRVLRRLFEQERPDILHLRSRLPAWLAWLAWSRMDERNRPRLVTTVHGFNSVNAYSRIMTRGERVICVSESVRDYVLRNYPGTPEERLVVIHRGVDPREYHTGFRPSSEWLERWYAEFPETRGKQLLTLPGRITRLKGHEDFINLMTRQKSRRIHGIVAGGARPKKQAYLEEIRQLAAVSGVADRITFTGHRSDLREILSISSVVLSLSQQPESFGRTTLEALALGTPVAGYATGGVGEILDTLFPQGRVEPGDLRAIVERVQNWEAAAPEIRHNNLFQLERMTSETLATYRSLLEG